MNTPATITEREQAFENARRRAGLWLAPVVFIALWFAPVAGLDASAHRLLAILGAVVTLWVTEALPLPVTALLGPAACVVCGVAGVRDTFRSFADPIIFLFLGSFLLAEAMVAHGLNRRVAFLILGARGVGESPARVLAAFGIVTAFISMWVSNTATTAMMFPIGVAILMEMARLESRRTGREVRFTELRYGTGLMLMAAFASSIGGLATPVGTPPNLIGLGLIERHLGVKIAFFDWMRFGLPLAAAMVTVLVVIFLRAFPAAPDVMAGAAEWIHAERAGLGPLTRGERNTLLAFAVTIALWILPGVITLVAGAEHAVVKWLNARVPEAVAALTGAVLLFVLPVKWREREFTLGWERAQRIDWGTILLFGGGLALGELMFSTGLARWIGEGLAGAFQARSELGLIVLFTVVAIAVSETTSNAASATMVVPVAIAVAQGADVPPLKPALAACLGASLGFMLPVSTPPNAIVYGSGCVPLRQMIRHGALLDVAGAVLIVVVVKWVV